MTETIWNRMTGRLFGGLIRGQVRALLADSENEFTAGSRPWTAERDRLEWDRGELLEQALQAWRVNPLARRIVELTSQYVVGGGLAVKAADPAAAEFVRAFWEHPLNRMDVRVLEWCDELTRSGNLFVLISTDAAGMSYVRAVPAAAVERIEARPNDIEQPLRFFARPTPEDPDPRPWPAWGAEDNRSQPVMLHYAINRPVGAQWGESDLAPLLRWLSRYANWLEDRARLNRYRNAFLYVVRARFTSEKERAARQSLLAANPPQSGSILVVDESEQWDVLNPRLESAEAAADGLALKKMIAAGAGIPLHFLAEPESSTRTTAEAAGSPSFRHFEQRQNYLMWLVGDVLRVVLQRRAAVDPAVDANTRLEIHGADLSTRDNSAMAGAAAAILPVLTGLRDRGLIDDAEMLRLAYRFAGEVVDVDAMLARKKAKKEEVENE